MYKRREIICQCVPFMIWVDEEATELAQKRSQEIKVRHEERQKKMLEQLSLPALLIVWYDDEEDGGGDDDEQHNQCVIVVLVGPANIMMEQEKWDVQRR